MPIAIYGSTGVMASSYLCLHRPRCLGQSCTAVILSFGYLFRITLPVVGTCLYLFFVCLSLCYKCSELWSHDESHDMVTWSVVTCDVLYNCVQTCVPVFTLVLLGDHWYTGKSYTCTCVVVTNISWWSLVYSVTP